MSDERTPASVSLEISAQSHIATLEETNPEMAHVFKEIFELSQHYKALANYYKCFHDFVRRQEARTEKAVNQQT